MPDLTPADVRRIVGYDDALILEIGANDGDDTAGFLQAFPFGWVECFECDQRAIEKFRRNITDPRATLYPVALADQCGELEFHPSDGRPPGQRWEGYGDHWDKSGSLLPNDHHTDYSPWLTFGEPVKVQAVTLDCWARQHLRRDVVDFAWVDVQSAEAIVLRGAQETIKRLRWWYCEVNSLPLYRGQPSLDDIEALLPGFERISKHGDNFLWKHRT